jgi:DNA-binding transcriptional LysR family regulator
MATAKPKWDDLRVFLEVARQGSVHAAAKRLMLDHSTVCRRIGKLESLLAVKLLDRSRKGIVVRSEAQFLLKHIEKMEFHAGSVQEAAVRRSADGMQVVRIATMEGMASQYLARRLPELYVFAPNLKVELVSNPQSVDLSRKEADVFLSFFNPKAAGLTSSKLAQFALHLYVSQSYVCQHGFPRSRDDLTRHAFVGYIDDLLAIPAVRWLDDVIINPRMAFQSNSIIAQTNAAAAGLGIVLLPTFVGATVEGLQRLLSDVVVYRDVWVSIRAEQAYQRRIKSVVQFLERIFQRDRDFLLGVPDRLEATGQSGGKRPKANGKHPETLPQQR